jgi:hypothetical protein
MSNEMIVVQPQTVTVVAKPVKATVDAPSGTPFNGGVILGNGYWTRSLESCKGVAQYLSKKGNTMVVAILDYRKIKNGTTMFTLVFIDKKNPDRVSGRVSRDRYGNLQVGFPAWLQDEAKEGAGYITEIQWF